MTTHPSVDVLNGLTVDVEDWAQSVFDLSGPLTGYFSANTHRILEALDRRGVRGTFFVLGLAAAEAPELVRELDSAGHEIQSHGYRHQPVHTLTPRQFREDLKRSKGLLEDLIGRPIVGYRAPVFSITLRNLWAFDALVDCGFTYDSSVFPVRTNRYGIAGVPSFPHRIRTPKENSLIEIPVASYRCLTRTLPLGGGGYFRLFPYAIIRRAISQTISRGHPATIYLHPYEYNPTEIGDLDQRIPRRLRFHQTLGRRGISWKVDQLLEEFRFGPLQDVLASLADIPTHDYFPACARSEDGSTAARFCPSVPRRDRRDVNRPVRCRASEEGPSRP